MSILKTDPVNADEVAEVRQAQHEIKKELVGSITPKRGHTLYEVNPVEQTINIAEFEEQLVSYEAKTTSKKGLTITSFKDGRKKIGLHQTPTLKKVLIKKKNCIYISALNRKNLMKKLEKRGIIKIVKN